MLLQLLALLAGCLVLDRHRPGRHWPLVLAVLAFALVATGDKYLGIVGLLLPWLVWFGLLLLDGARERMKTEWP